MAFVRTLGTIAAALALAQAVAYDPLCFTLRRWDPSLFRRTEKSLPGAPAKPRYSEECILSAVARRKRIALKPEIAVPRIRYASSTPLAEFQDAVEPQWNIRPDLVLNVFVDARNEIFIMDDSSYYERMRRFVDDSIAHEFTHFIQVRYQGASLRDADDSLESDAIDVQTWFRETYMRDGLPPEAPCRG